MLSVAWQQEDISEREHIVYSSIHVQRSDIRHGNGTVKEYVRSEIAQTPSGFGTNFSRVKSA